MDELVDRGIARKKLSVLRAASRRRCGHHIVCDTKEAASQSEKAHGGKGRIGSGRLRRKTRPIVVSRPGGTGWSWSARSAAPRIGCTAGPR